MNQHDLYQTAKDLLLQHGQTRPRTGQATQGTPKEGIYPTSLPGVRMFWQTSHGQKEAGVYPPCLVFIFSGSKHGELGRWRFTYDTAHYLLLTSTYPLQCNTEASPGVPLAGIQIDLDRAMVSQLLRDTDEAPTHTGPPPAQVPVDPAFSGIECYPVEPLLRRHMGELLLTLQHPVEAQLFGTERIRAVVFALLQGSGRPLLQSWSLMDGQFARFQKAVAFIQAHYQQALDIETLSAHVGLSAASLQRVFKRYASDSPMQYLKKIRLNLARTHIIQTGATVQTAAHHAGYESPSHFSREFKRYFGYPPGQIRPPVLLR